ncbi:PREDICTED: regulator of nonsense transcripts UPF3-like isoform X2 [Tarenaya hassleriana]|uniref:regulator of nonsense transcripts UPF3-like isoform X2 n=1 Tax=Tarenaya hassleriana TaxID=28532 RepID=UPI00053C70E2|nr:PREDICTED: regulator of nonsense transcripts UPF3-like isoform X2 [Tarenaya hassleriana]
MKDLLQKRKVVVRHLPPSISQSDLLSHIDARFADRYNWFAFRSGKSSHKNQKYSRAYIEFKTPEDVCDFASFFNGHVFVNEKGAQCKAVVEYAPSQRAPRPCGKKDPREGTICKDPDYLEFLKIIAKPVENLPSAEIQLERKEAEQSGTTRDTLIVTPLMEFIRKKRAAVIETQGLSDVRKASRRARAASANKPNSRSSKRSSEKKKYVAKDHAKNMLQKAKSAYVASFKQDNQHLTSSEKEIPENETAVSVIESSLPGIPLTMESGKKKILLLKAKNQDSSNPLPQSEQQIETSPVGSSLASRQNQKSDVGGKLIKGILLKHEPRQSQSSSSVQPQQKAPSSNMENSKRPPRPANTRADGKFAGKDYPGPGTLGEKQERRMRNKERPDRVVWAPLHRADGLSVGEDHLSSSAANNGEVNGENLVQKTGEVAASCGGRHSYSMENGSARHTSRRIGARSRKDDGLGMTGDGKSLRRGGSGGSNSHEKQMWVQKSSSGS